MGHVTLLDGGMGRELERAGAPFRQPEWSALAMIESPAHVRSVHESYARAGAEVITTNAYALVPFHLGGDRFRSDGRRLAELAGSLARQVADEHGVRVAGCLPPVLGSYLPSDFVADQARPILQVLVSAQAPFVDLWLAETQSSIAEVRAVRSVLDSVGDDHPLWVSYTLEDTLTEGVARLRSTEPVSEAVQATVAERAEAVLFNCSQPEVMEAAVDEAAAMCDLAVGVYANAFALVDDDVDGGVAGSANESLHRIRGDLTPEGYAAFARRWITAGATIVGGCCGIGPEHITALQG